MKMMLLNEKQTRLFIVDSLPVVRPGWNCHRISRSYLNSLNLRVRHLIREDLKRQPSRGKTLKEMQI